MAWYHTTFAMAFQLMYTFITSCAGYAPFVLMSLIERHLEERKWMKLKAQQAKLHEQEKVEEQANYREGEEEDGEGDEYERAYGRS